MPQAYVRASLAVRRWMPAGDRGRPWWLWRPSAICQRTPVVGMEGVGGSRVSGTRWRAGGSCLGHRRRYDAASRVPGAVGQVLGSRVGRGGVRTTRLPVARAKQPVRAARCVGVRLREPRERWTCTASLDLAPRASARRRGAGWRGSIAPRPAGRHPGRASAGHERRRDDQHVRARHPTRARRAGREDERSGSTGGGIGRRLHAVKPTSVVDRALTVPPPSVASGRRAL